MSQMSHTGSVNKGPCTGRGLGSCRKSTVILFMLQHYVTT